MLVFAGIEAFQKVNFLANFETCTRNFSVIDETMHVSVSSDGNTSARYVLRMYQRRAH